MDEPVLQISQLSAGYGERTDAIRQIDLELGVGEVRGVIGANGAGKSTLLKVLGGLMPHRSGDIGYLGDPVRPSERAASRLRRGICLLPEGHRVIPTLTVAENLRLATITRWPRGNKALAERRLPLVHELFPVLAGRPRQLAGYLSGGEQQMVSIGRALMSDPKVLLLDEPSLGLAPTIVDRIYEAIERIRETGVSVIVVEQNHSRLAGICSRIDVLRLGEIVHSTNSASLDEAEIQRAYFG